VKYFEGLHSISVRELECNTTMPPRHKHASSTALAATRPHPCRPLKIPVVALATAPCRAVCRRSPSMFLEFDIGFSLKHHFLLHLNV
jgi:hypothetical protein